jgi:transposase-like protein
MIRANSNLPCSTWEGDPTAPWNQPEPGCPKCDSTNFFEANTKVFSNRKWKIRRMYICRDCWTKFD